MRYYTDGSTWIGVDLLRITPTRNSLKVVRAWSIGKRRRVRVRFESQRSRHRYSFMWTSYQCHGSRYSAYGFGFSFRL